MLDKTRDFQLVKKHKKTDTTGKFKHEVDIGTLAGTEGRWFTKSTEKVLTAYIELIAQEFFRLLVPYQPETRIGFSKTRTGFLNKDKKTEYHIFSKEAEGFQLLKDLTSYSGMGDLTVIALLLQENDFKNGNLGFDTQYRVIKVDGEQCFAELLNLHKGKDGGSYDIPETVLDTLPYPVGYLPFNWINYRKMGAASHHTVPQSYINGQGRAEINRALLKICLLSDSFIQQFVNTYLGPSIPAKGQEMVRILTSRRDTLKRLALANDSFLAYINSPAAAVSSQSLINQMLSQKFNGLTPIIPDPRLIEANYLAQTSLEIIASIHQAAQEQSKTLSKQRQDYLAMKTSEILTHMNNLQQLILIRDALLQEQQTHQNNQVQPIRRDCEGLLHTMADLSLGLQDTKLQQYLLRQHLAVISLKNNAEAKTLQDQIQDDLTAMQRTTAIARDCLETIATLSDINPRKSTLELIKDDILDQRFDSEALLSIQEDLDQQLEEENEITETRQHCQALLDELSLYEFSSNDHQLQEFIRAKSQALQTRDLSTLEDLEQELQNTLASVASDEAMAIKEILLDFRTRAQQFFPIEIGLASKADRIEAALNNLPLAARGTAISSAQVNEVQRALASHRSIFISGKVFETENHEIDMKLSANTFILLRKIFPVQVPIRERDRFFQCHDVVNNTQQPANNFVCV